MSAISILLGLAPKKFTTGVSAAVVFAGSLTAGAVFVPAFADAGCNSRSQTIYTSYINGPAEQAGKADNTSCSQKKLMVRIRKDDTWGRDETVAESTWTRMSGSYERVAYGCRDDEASYFSEQKLDGGDSKKSTYRDFDNCQD